MAHPPPFHLDHRLSDWPDCRFEIRCPKCRKSSFPPVRLLVAQIGDRTFRGVLKALKCETCGVAPAPVYLLAGQHREHCFGGPPDWAIELRQKPGDSG